LSKPVTIEAQRLSGVRGERVLFRDVGFRLANAQVLTVQGPNGSGKDSLLRIIAGFIAPASGILSIQNGAERLEDAEERGKLIGWLGHLDAARSQLAPLELLESFRLLYDTKVDLHAALERVGLIGVAGLPCQYLSAGQKRRLALARLLVCDRSIWLLDEPLTSLDPKGKLLATELIEEHRSAGGLAIIATHEGLALQCEALVLGESGR
jgi:heme exporter protein A